MGTDRWKLYPKTGFRYLNFQVVAEAQRRMWGDIAGTAGARVNHKPFQNPQTHNRHPTTKTEFF